MKTTATIWIQKGALKSFLNSLTILQEDGSGINHITQSGKGVLKENNFIYLTHEPKEKIHYLQLNVSIMFLASLMILPAELNDTKLFFNYTEL